MPYDWDAIAQELGGPNGAIAQGMQGMAETVTTAPIQQKIGMALQIQAFKQMAEDRERENAARAMQKQYMEEALAAMQMERQGRSEMYKAYQDDLKMQAALRKQQEAEKPAAEGGKGSKVKRQTSPAMETARMNSFGSGYSTVGRPPQDFLDLLQSQGRGYVPNPMPAIPRTYPNPNAYNPIGVPSAWQQGQDRVYQQLREGITKHYNVNPLNALFGEPIFQRASPPASMYDKGGNY